MRIEQPVGIKADKCPDQVAIRHARHGLYREERPARPIRQVMCLERQARDDAETATASTFDRPEQLGIPVGIGDPHLPVGGYHLRLQQRCGGGPVMLREAAKATALYEAGDADSRAAAALHVTTCLCRYGVVDMEPD